MRALFKDLDPERTARGRSGWVEWTVGLFQPASEEDSMSRA